MRFSYLALSKRSNRPSAKPICDQQFLGGAQSSTAGILNVFEEHRQVPKLPFSNRFCRRSNV
ncbi:MAG: hypothetical protein NMK33_02000 [Candidatus Cardinium sp.]|uniref:hypothetical protein n=1 Tax=Cardinium endosymbiont of Dermatophagoides farinae TaxID=2597823 RepID=UPI001181E4E4|nr:hypothetical protein [Cardinium endosymbiont of Dermatophagoides farinae]TSJ81257.1 hypothetical protein FPG78_04675 [Cardinium endosymbiont of Dermatophagoides farinae]UWW97315.1 MAG: hypothetical protein NMK33_02000 [Candidatus Cardinium sp.]